MPHSEDPDESDAHTSPAGPVDGKGGARLRLVIGIVVGLALLGGGIGFLLMLVPAAPPRVQVVDGTRMELETVPAEPTAGPATLRMAIRDLTGRPLRGGQVWLNVGMDGMPSMGGAQYLQAGETEPGIYTATLVFPMAGVWDVRVRAEVRGDTPRERHFVIAVR